jgi:hypothetical protein
VRYALDALTLRLGRYVVTEPARDSDSDASSSHRDSGPGSQATPRAAGRAAGPGRFNLKLGRARIRIHHRHSDSEVSMDIEGVVVLIELVTVFWTFPVPLHRNLTITYTVVFNSEQRKIRRFQWRRFTHGDVGRFLSRS